MSLASTLFDSEHVSLEDFLDNVLAPALFAELEDDEEIVEDDDENEYEQEYEEVMVSRNLLSMMKHLQPNSMLLLKVLWVLIDVVIHIKDVRGMMIMCLEENSQH